MFIAGAHRHHSVPLAPSPSNPLAKSVLFILLALACLAPFTEPWMALLAGITIALVGLTAFAAPSKKASKLLIQCAVVLLGFSVELSAIGRGGLMGLAFAVGTIVLTLVVGFSLGTLLSTPIKLSALLSSGTAICGGSAIAATGPAIRASDTHMAVALACIFVLNGIALILFPPIGHALALTQEQFGAWAAVAIHDVSSVVGASKAYGDIALQEATIIKLTRALWIVPVALGLSIAVPWLERRAAAKTGEPVAPVKLSLSSILPWFIAAFVAAAAVRTFVPAVALPRFEWWGDSLLSIADVLKAVAKRLMTLALFFIGAGLSRQAIAAVGWRPFAQAIVMWVVISVVALFVVRSTVTGRITTSAQVRPQPSTGVLPHSEADFFLPAEP